MDVTGALLILQRADRAARCAQASGHCDLASTLGADRKARAVRQDQRTQDDVPVIHLRAGDLRVEVAAEVLFGLLLQLDRILYPAPGAAELTVPHPEQATTVLDGERQVHVCTPTYVAPLLDIHPVVDDHTGLAHGIPPTIVGTYVCLAKQTNTLIIANFTNFVNSTVYVMML